jgi:hypothetical protein
MKHPITFRIPRTSERDEVFGLSRSWYYAMEQLGKLRLIRLRRPGNLRGVTVVRTADVQRLLDEAVGDSPEGACS